MKLKSNIKNNVEINDKHIELNILKEVNDVNQTTTKNSNKVYIYVYLIYRQTGESVWEYIIHI